MCSEKSERESYQDDARMRKDIEERRAKEDWEAAQLRGLGRLSTGGALVAQQPHAREAIRARAERLRSEADRLDRLAAALPGEMSPEANEALWGLVTRAGSR